MASEQPLGKPAATGRKLSPDRRSSQPQPQIPSPLSSDGLELMRDTHCGQSRHRDCTKQLRARGKLLMPTGGRIEQRLSLLHDLGHLGRVEPHPL